MGRNGQPYSGINMAAPFPPLMTPAVRHFDQRETSETAKGSHEVNRRSQISNTLFH